MRALNATALAILAWLAASSTAFAQVQLTIRDGRVSLIAKDATIRQILTEYARIGQTRVVNVERIPGGPVTLQLTDVSEQQALEVLLRSVGGYVLAPRPVAASNLSRFDRIIVMPPSQVPRAAAAAPAPTFQPAFGQPRAAADDDSDDDRSAPIRAGPPLINRGQVLNVFPQPQVVNPQPPPLQPTPAGAVPLLQPQPNVAPSGATPAGGSLGATPSSPFGGVSVPGMIVPAPTQQQPGVPVIPNRPEG